MWHITGLPRSPQLAHGQRRDLCHMCSPINTTGTVSYSVPVEIQAMIVSVATVSLEWTGIGTRGTATCADGNGSRFNVGADAGQVEAEVGELHG
jgi:hypothetical protein